jgi:hypothetical protein
VEEHLAFNTWCLDETKLLARAKQLDGATDKRFVGQIWFLTSFDAGTLFAARTSRSARRADGDNPVSYDPELLELAKIIASNPLLEPSANFHEITALNFLLDLVGEFSETMHLDPIRATGSTFAGRIDFDDDSLQAPGTEGPVSNFSHQQHHVHVPHSSMSKVCRASSSRESPDPLLREHHEGRTAEHDAPDPPGHHVGGVVDPQMRTRTTEKERERSQRNEPSSLGTDERCGTCTC